MMAVIRFIKVYVNPPLKQTWGYVVSDLKELEPLDSQDWCKSSFGLDLSAILQSVVKCLNHRIFHSSGRTERYTSFYLYALFGSKISLCHLTWFDPLYYGGCYLNLVCPYRLHNVSDDHTVSPSLWGNVPLTYWSFLNYMGIKSHPILLQISRSQL